MRNRRPLRTLGVIAVSGLIGYLIGPPIVQAAANLVVIKDADSSAKAQVANGRLKVDTELVPATGGTLSVDTELQPNTDGSLNVDTEANLDAYGRIFVNADNEPDYPPSYFSFIAYHNFMFDNPSAGPPVPAEDDSDHNPCPADADRIVVTGVDLSQSQPESGGVGQLVHFFMQPGFGERVFEQYHPQGFHDDTGIQFPVADGVSLFTKMNGKAGSVCDESGCVDVTESFEVPIVVQGYCYWDPA